MLCSGAGIVLTSGAMVVCSLVTGMEVSEDVGAVVNTGALDVCMNVGMGGGYRLGSDWDLG